MTLKFAIATLTLALTFMSCKKTEQDKTPSTPTGQSEVTDNTVVVKKMFAAFNDHDWNAMANCYQDSASFLDPSLGKAYIKQSHSQIVKKYTALQQAAADIKDDITAMYACGDQVVAEFISSGTSGGQAWSMPICSVFTIKDGKIVKDATYYDN